MQPLVRSIISFGLVAAICCFATAADAQDWPRFRGPNGSGVSHSSNLPTELRLETNLLWRVSVPRGISSPIVAAGRLFVTSYENDARTVHCLDARSGETLWTQTVSASRLENYTRPSGPATPTPVADEERVYVLFPDIGVLAFSMEGEELWRSEQGPFHSMHGVAGSLMAVDGTVVLVADQLEDSYMAAFDGRSGKPVWRVDRLSGLTGGFSTPVVHRPKEGPPQLIASGPFELAGYDPATGEKQWWLSGVSQAPVCVPLLWRGDVLLCEPVAQPVSISMMSRVDKNKDGKYTLEEAESDVATHRLLRRIDQHWGNCDDAVDTAEWEAAFGAFENHGGLISVELGEQGELPPSSIRWSYRKSLPYIPSPLVYDDILYVAQNGGIVTAMNPENGDVFQRARVEGGAGQYYASPVAGDGKIYLVDTTGKISVIEAGKQWKTLSTSELGEPCHATPAISQGRIYIRSDASLFCFGEG